MAAGEKVLLLGVKKRVDDVASLERLMLLVVTRLQVLALWNRLIASAVFN